MSPVRKVAYVSPVSSADGHRRIRGALSYADTHPNIVIRDFRLPTDFANGTGPVAAVNELRAWHPDGVLSFLDDKEIQKLLTALPKPPPVANMAAVSIRPGVAVVAGSLPRLIEIAVRHFRQQGIRSIAMFNFEGTGAFQDKTINVFNQIVKPANPKQATLIQKIANALATNPDAPVKPVPPRLVAWLQSLPKPAGIFSVDNGGGGYLIRVCHTLGLRVPEDIAVIGVDDVDLCLTSNPTLTSVVPASEVIGFEAMKVLGQMMNGQPSPADSVRVEATDLHVRQSTGLNISAICDIAAAVNYINQHACTGVSVEQLLKETQRVSKMTFHKHFLAATGQTPGEAIHQRQIAEARRLLAETKQSLTLVAEQSGFNSSSDFARAFRAAQGMTPSDYRNQTQTKKSPAK